MNFIMKQLLKSKMKDVPPEDQEKIFAMLDKNPKLFTEIASEVQQKIKGGMDQMTAVKAVMQSHMSELQALKKEVK